MAKEETKAKKEKFEEKEENNKYEDPEEKKRQPYGHYFLGVSGSDSHPGPDFRLGADFRCHGYRQAGGGRPLQG
mgnify:CR=1 FL=1